MRKRNRNYVMMAVTVLVAFLYTRIAGDWSDVAFYGGAAGVLVLLLLIGLPWLEFAPDGAFRKQPQP
jgi:hypothetical protein